MKTLQGRIRDVELSIYARKALLNQQTELLRQEIAKPKFFSVAIVASFALGYFLFSRKNSSKYVFNILKKVFFNARLLLRYLPHP